MSRSFHLPDLGEGIHEAEILAIPVAVGMMVNEGDIILEVETDKAAVEIPSPFAGRVSRITVKEGDVVKVGEPLVHFENEDVGQAKYPQQQEMVATSPLQSAPPPKTVVPASPSTRKLARELGVALHRVPATGKAGLVTREDVEKYAASLQAGENEQPEEKISASSQEHRSEPSIPATLPDFSQWGKIERLPFRSIRRATAKRMSDSWSQIVHVHCEDTIDITELEKFRQRHKKEIENCGGRLTMTVFAMKAVATALKTYPLFNSSLDIQSQEIVVKHYYNLGIAVDSSQGLVVPVIRDVDRKSIRELAIELQGAIETVRQGKQKREDMVGSTFTISNAGALGGHRFTAIINHPEVAILGLGEARMQPAVITGNNGQPQIAPRLQMPIVLCFDHRVVDGGDAIRFLKLIIDALSDPDELLITMI